MNKAIFLDRDGVINVDTGYVYKKSDFILNDGVIDALEFFSEMGFLIIIVTNQSGIGRGYFSEEEYSILNNYMIKIFRSHSIKITDVFYCPHHPLEHCSCRKPKSKMIEDAIEKHSINRNASYLIGDRHSDIMAGKAARLKKCFLIKGNRHVDINNYYDPIYSCLFEVAKKWKNIA